MYVTAGTVRAPTERRFLLSMSVSAGFHIHASMWKMQLSSKTQNNSININALCITTKKNTLDVFICTLEAYSYFSDLKKLGWSLRDIWICFNIHGVSAKITERCESGSRAGRAELFFRYFVSASACFGRSHLSAAHNMEHKSGGR